MAKTKDLASARNSIWRLIKFRQRSEKEIRDRLALQGYDTAIIEDIVRYFKDAGYINDTGFARNWIVSRLSKPLGFKLIRIELKKKGISEEIVEGLFAEQKQIVDERALVEGLAGKYFEKLSRTKELPEKIKAKLYGYLIRRGFSPEVISEAIQQIVNAGKPVFLNTNTRKLRG